MITTVTTSTVTTITAIAAMGLTSLISAVAVVILIAFLSLKELSAARPSPGAKLTTQLDHSCARLVVEFRREGSGTNPGDVRLGYADHSVDRLWPYPATGGSATGCWVR